MVSWLQKIPSGNESHAEGENAEITVPNYGYRDWTRIVISTNSLPDIVDAHRPVLNNILTNSFVLKTKNGEIWNCYF